MRDRTRDDDSIYMRPEDRARDGVVELSGVEVETVRTGRGSADAEVSFRDREDDETEIQRVGGRRRFRPELLLLIAGPLFIVAALLKPWPTPPPAAASTSPSTLAAQATGTVTDLLPSPSFPDIPPGNYRPFVDPDGDFQGSSTGITSSVTGRWATVDWTILNAVDQHDTWGFGTAVVPDVARVPDATPTPAPALSWSAATPRPNPTVLKVRSGSNVFALSVTWPSTEKVTAVTFRYLGGPDHPPYQPPVGFPSFTEVSPIPATQVALAAKTPAVTPTPGGPAATASAGAAASRPIVTEPAAAGTIRSGQFWIPPSEASWNAATTSVPAAWHTLPWPWPNGTYRVTFVTTTGSTAFLFTIQQVAV